MASPPNATHTKLSSASDNSNDPVSAAATANRIHTSPDASLNSASPCSRYFIRAGIGARAAIEDTATGSVGDSTAASAKATGNGTAGISQ